MSLTLNQDCLLNILSHCDSGTLIKSRQTNSGIKQLVDWILNFTNCYELRQNCCTIQLLSSFGKNNQLVEWSQNDYRHSIQLLEHDSPRLKIHKKPQSSTFCVQVTNLFLNISTLNPYHLILGDQLTSHNFHIIHHQFMMIHCPQYFVLIKLWPTVQLLYDRFPKNLVARDTEPFCWMCREFVKRHPKFFESSRFVDFPINAIKFQVVHDSEQILVYCDKFWLTQGILILKHVHKQSNLVQHLYQFKYAELYWNRLESMTAVKIVLMKENRYLLIGHYLRSRKRNYDLFDVLAGMQCKVAPKLTLNVIRDFKILENQSKFQIEIITRKKQTFVFDLQFQWIFTSLRKS